MPALKTVFMGTPQLASTTLEALLGSPHVQVVAVVTQPDRPKGRDLKLTPSPVKVLALRTGLPVLQPQRARDPEFLESLRAFAPSLIAVAAFGQILPVSILELPPLGCLNVHTSLLPRYRGAAPIQRAILDGETETGVTIMKMDAGLDTGPIVAQEKTAIASDEDSQCLHDRLARIGAHLLLSTIPDYAAGRLQPRPQPATGVSYAPKIKKQDGLINWTLPAQVLVNRVRGLAPWPGAFTFIGDPPQRHLLKIWKAKAATDTGQPGQIIAITSDCIAVACGQGALRIELLQLEGGRRLAAREFLTGHPLTVGQRLAAGDGRPWRSH